MTTSSSEARVIRAVDLVSAPALRTPELRTGSWTRLGDASVLGDVVTEATLSTLAEQARAAGQSQGYAVGWASGRREADAVATQELRDSTARREAEDDRRATEHAEAVAALTRAAEALVAATEQAAAVVETRAVALALAVTEAVLGARAAAATPADVVGRAVAVLPTEGLVQLRLAPAVAGSVAAADLPARVSVVADAGLGPADAVVEVAESVVDLRVGTALQRVTEALA